MEFAKCCLGISRWKRQMVVGQLGFTKITETEKLKHAMKHKLLLCLALVLSSVVADANDFTVSVVGQRQSNKWQYKEEGLPLVFCPQSTSKQTNVQGADKTSYNDFFVVIHSTQKMADTITMASSGWYYCLRFKITDSSGKVYSVSRPVFNWSANPEESWTFPSGGLRVFAVDFTSEDLMGQMTDWQGLPPSPSVPEIVSMTATFCYGDSEGKKTVTSEPTKVYLCEVSK
jgi:hypothetical protein